MDLSGVIFVLLAVVWAGYLLPKALRRHDEVAAEAPVDSFSETIRVFERTPAVLQKLTGSTAPAKDESRSENAPAGAQTHTPAELAVARPMMTRSAARAAARRRRQVLLSLLGITVVVVALAAFGGLGWAWVAASVAAVVGWLVLCRVMVRRTFATGSHLESQENAPDSTFPEATVSGFTAPESAASGSTDRAPRRESAPVESASAEDDSLWDPLPLTLPTYVGKAPARRTVRTIELTGMTSAGHDAADSKLVHEQHHAEEALPQRKAAGA